MANLSDVERKELWAKFMSDSSGRRELIPFDKTDARGVIDTIDTKLDVFIDGLDVPPSSDIAQLSLRQRLKLIQDNVVRRLEKV